MDKKYRKLRIKQLDEQFKTKKLVKEIQVPPQGWVWEIRNTLGMTYSQLAARLGVSPPAIVNYEKSEIEETISLKTLEKTAEAMKCKLIYAIVPETSLQDILDVQSVKSAKKILGKASHSMKLEKQGLSRKENLRQLEELKEEIKSSFKSNIWNEE